MTLLVLRLLLFLSLFHVTQTGLKIRRVAEGDLDLLVFQILRSQARATMPG